ncbi:MAG: 5'/3'-nucleotidase SurE [Oligoflexia bacterium]|nr:5'/3'-nucleotidase SurE [Oligoflexia bacterium]
MEILISNDDGFESPGIIKLANALSTIGNVTVVAPHRERSTSGHSLTLHKPLRCGQVKENYYWVSGSPADCVYMATRMIMKKKPDIIVSGINRGANLGNDIYYSGTVAAAREGAYFGSHSIAFSLCLGNHTDITHMYWDTAAEFAKTFVPMVIKKNIPLNNIMNVNVPNLPSNKIKGVKVSKQGLRYYSDEITNRTDPRHKHYYWLGGEYKGFENIPGSDCVHVDQDYISIVPLKIDSTNYDLLEELKTWEILFQS